MKDVFWSSKVYKDDGMWFNLAFNGWEEETGEKMYSLWPSEFGDNFLCKLRPLKLHENIRQWTISVGSKPLD